MEMEGETGGPKTAGGETGSGRGRGGDVSLAGPVAHGPHASRPPIIKEPQVGVILDHLALIIFTNIKSAMLPVLGLSVEGEGGKGRG